MSDRSNPFKNRQLRVFLLSIVGLGVALGIGIAVQGVFGWWWAPIGAIGFAGFAWFMAWVLRNNP